MTTFILLIVPHTETRTPCLETLKQSFTVLACASLKEAQKKLAKASVSLIIAETIAPSNLGIRLSKK